VQTFYRGMDKGVRKGKKLADALIKRVQDGVKDHPVSKRQMSVLMTRIRNTNLYTPGSISKLARTIEKIADDADYAEKLRRATALQKLVRRRSKAKGLSQELVSVAKAFSKLDPTIDPDNYSNVAGALLNSFKKPGSAGYAPVSLRSVNNFIERQTAAQNEELAKQLREVHGLSDDFSLDEIMAVIGDEDSAFETEDKAAKAREKLQQAAEYTMMALPEDSSDPDIKTLREAPLDEFSAQQLVQYIRTVDNIAVNNDRSGVEQVKVQIEAARNLKEMKALKATGKIGTISAQTYALPMLFNKVWNNVKAAAEAYRLTGAGEIYNATSRVEGEEAAFYQAFADKLKAVKGSKDPDTQLLAGLYAELIRHPKGADPQAHFESSKRAIEESIRRLSVSEKHSQMAQDVERLYNQYFADTKNIQEATAKIKGTPAAEMAKFIRDRFQKHINDRLRENTERLHNEPYIEEENYSPRKHIFVDPEVSEEGHRMSSALPGKPRQSGTSMRAVNVLPNGAAINFELYHVAFQAYREAMHDIEASRHKMRFREFMKLPGSSEALGGVDNKRAII